MSLLTEIGFYFQFETQQEKDQEYWINAEVDLNSGGYTLDVFTDNDCKIKITEVIKELNLEIYRDIDRETFRQADLKRQEYAEENVHPIDINETY